jgi:hypothetical protein
MNIDAMTAALSAANLEQRSQSGLESMQEATNLPSLSDAAILGAIGIDLSGECDEIKLNVHKGTLSPSDLEIPLVGRQTNLTMIADMFTRTENACISLGSRTDYARYRRCSRRREDEAATRVSQASPCGWCHRRGLCRISIRCLQQWS